MLVGVLLGCVLWVFVGTPRYVRSLARAREATRRYDLLVICSAVRAFTKDTGSSPKSLDQLVEAKYIYLIPIDPITRQRFSMPVCVDSDDQQMDPIQTIPGSQGQRSESSRKSLVTN